MEYLHYIWDMFGAKPQVQNLLVLFTLIASILFSYRTSKQNKKALNVDINFRALEIRRNACLKVDEALAIICELPAYGENYYPGEEGSKFFKPQYQYDEEIPLSFEPDDYDLIMKYRNEALSSIDEAALLFPALETSFAQIRKQLITLINIWPLGGIAVSRTQYNKNKKLIIKQRDKILVSMKEYLDLKKLQKHNF